jgi:hypothetical protein
VLSAAPMIDANSAVDVSLKPFDANRWVAAINISGFLDIIFS